MNNIAYLEDSDFTGMDLNVKSNGKPVAILLQGSFCGYCHQFAPEYTKAAKMLKGKAYMATIQIDGDQGEKAIGSKMMKMINAKGVPTVVFYKNGKYVETYEGPRKAEDLVAAISKY